MQTKNEEKTLLLIIRWGLPTFILCICLIMLFVANKEYQKELMLDKISIEEQFIKNEKLRIKENVNTVHTYLTKKLEDNTKALKKRIKEEVYTAYTIAASIYNKNKDTKSKEQITKQIKDALADIRFNDGRGYFFIYDMRGTNIFHPTKPEREGKNYFYDKDVTGVYRNQIAIDIIKNKGEGFFNWFFHKPNNTKKEYEKIGFVKKFEPYDWFIGTGEYVEDFEKDLQKDVLKYISHLRFKNNGFIGIIDYDGNFLYHQSKKVLHANIFKEKRFSHISAFYKSLLANKSQDAFDVHKMKIQNIKMENETKTLYAKKFEEWRWFIATGFRLSDSKPIVDQSKLSVEKKYQKYKQTVFIYGLVAIFILLLITFFIAKVLENKFIHYKSSLEKQIEDNIEQKNRLLKAQEVAHIGDWQLDLNTEKARWSKEILKIFGIEDQNIQAGPEYLKSIMHTDDIHCFVDSMQNCVKNNDEHRCEYRIYRPNGEIRWIDCRGQLDKDTNAIIGTVQDITETKELIIKKQEQDEMLLSQSRLAAMGEMISMIAHQWRQPLAIISMNANNTLLDIELDNLAKNDTQKNTVSILEQTEHLSKTIDDFRNFFKPNKEKNNASIVKVFNDSMNFMIKSLESHSITYTLNFDKDEKVLMYQRELMQVLINIIKNAQEALISNRETSREIEIDISSDDDYVKINICNNGGQIEKANINKIFEPYFSTKNKHNGTGLGLYMSKLIIQEHMHGKFFVKNIKDGVCFYIHIPKTFEA